ncbi:MAG TPA: hypothetical protein VFL64_05880 [Rhizobacter sp.]|nr:hypothetical protein [Rhizobacter sp.]
MISFNSSASLLSYLSTKTSSADNGAASLLGGASTSTVSEKAKTQAAATTEAALKAAGSRPQAAVPGRALDKQQAALAADLRAALGKANIKLSGPVEFSVSSDGAVALKGAEADKAAVSAFLKADTSQPGFSARIATQARDALKLSATIRQNAAISQAARYAGNSGGVMSLYTSLMQQSTASTAVFSVSPTASSLTYPGSLATKA